MGGEHVENLPVFNKLGHLLIEVGYEAEDLLVRLDEVLAF
jgi:hypothetical protein